MAPGNPTHEGKPHARGALSWKMPIQSLRNPSRPRALSGRACLVRPEGHPARVGYGRPAGGPWGRSWPAHGATVLWDTSTPQAAFELTLLRASHEGIDTLVVAVAADFGLEFGLLLRTDAL